MKDQVNHPSHYNRGKIEVIEFLEDQFMGRPHEWNAVKYLSRSDLKHPDKEIEDLDKAVWYIKRKIELLKAQKSGAVPKRPNDMNQKSTSAIDALSGDLPVYLRGFAKLAQEQTVYQLFGEWIENEHGAVCLVPYGQSRELIGQKGVIVFTESKTDLGDKKT